MINFLMTDIGSNQLLPTKRAQVECQIPASWRSRLLLGNEELAEHGKLEVRAELVVVHDSLAVRNLH
jgi:hypothetical protein